MPGPLELAQFKEMCEARSKNGCDPWFAKDDTGAGHAPYGSGENPPPMGLWRHGGTVLAEDEFTMTISSVEPFSDADAVFISAAWHYAPILVDLVADLRAENDRLRKRVVELLERVTA
jgi:hypothetical protein